MTIKIDHLSDSGDHDDGEVIRTISFTVSGADSGTLEAITSGLNREARRYIDRMNKKIAVGGKVV